MARKTRSIKSPSNQGAGRKGELGRRDVKKDGSTKGQWFAKVMTTTLPGTVIIIGIMLMAIGEKSGEYVVTSGVVAQFAGLAWKIHDVHRRSREKR